MTTTEYRTVRVPANPKKQTKELNKLAKDGWQLIQVKHVLGAGSDRAYLKRNRAEKITSAPPGDSFLAKLFKRIVEDNKREAGKRRQARELKKQAKHTAKSDKNEWVPVNNLSIESPGVGAEKQATEGRRRKFAVPLVAEGYTFGPLTPQDWPVVDRLVHNHLTVPVEWALNTGKLGIVVKDSHNTLVSAVVTEVVSIDNQTLLLATHLVTIPEHRGKGIATVLLGMLNDITNSVGAPPPAMTIGFCAEKGIKLYRRAGFTVGDAHSPAIPALGLPFPSMSTTNTNYPYPIYRAW